MKVSLNTIKQLINFELPSVEELVQRINAQLGGVEDIVDLGAKYKDATIVKVVECVKHPNADKLSICKIDIGESELVQVVCGAPNVHTDMWTVWLPPESIVPSTYGEAEPFTLGARELRGEMSHGMLAAADELAIGTDHEGIVELTDRDVSHGGQLVAGTSFAKLFGLDDTIIDIENKMFTHRPDCFGQLGVAREIAGIFGHVFIDPDWYVEHAMVPELASNTSFELTVQNEAGELVPRLMVCGFDNVTVGKSPMWLQAKLVAMGSKPINNVVDITNYVMLMTAQPTHAYDYDKLTGGLLGARMAREGESIRLLNDKTYQLTTDDIVIVDGSGPIGLAGIMGGGDSEVSESTTRIVFECATFDMYAVRKSSMRHGLFTDALTRFNKGQSMLMSPYVTQFTAGLFEELAGAKQATDVYDDLLSDTTTWRVQPSVIPMLDYANISAAFVNQRLGLDLSIDAMMEMLTYVGFECERTDDGFSYWAPAWRMDIQDKEDVVEEIGRLYGFDKLPRELPMRSTRPVSKNQLRLMRQTIRDGLARGGANEVLTYSFVHENVLSRAGQNPQKAYKVANALSPDLQYYRLSVLPSLLDKVNMNTKSGHDEYVLFELGKAHHVDMLNDESLPLELSRVAGVYASKKPSDGAAYFVAKTVLSTLFERMHISGVRYQPLSEFDYKEYDVLKQLTAPFDPERSAMIWIGDMFFGVVGEFRQSVSTSFKLPERSAGFEVFESLFSHTSSASVYRQLSRFPSVSQDLTLKVPASVRYEAVIAIVQETVDSSNFEATITPLNSYMPSGADEISVSFRIQLASLESTLSEADASAVIASVVDRASEQLGAQQA